jgi:hypothetical protein
MAEKLVFEKYQKPELIKNFNIDMNRSDIDRNFHSDLHSSSLFTVTASFKWTPDSPLLV